MGRAGDPDRLLGLHGLHVPLRPSFAPSPGGLTTGYRSLKLSMVRNGLVAAVLLALAACSGQQQAPMTPQPTGQTLVYECGDYEFVVRTGPGEVALYLPEDYRVLGQVRSASGAKCCNHHP